MGADESAAGGGLEGRLERLEGIVSELEREDLELDTALRLFEEGVGHLRAARALLESAEVRIERLLRPEDAEGGEAAGERPGEAT